MGRAVPCVIVLAMATAEWRENLEGLGLDYAETSDALDLCELIATADENRVARSAGLNVQHVLLGVARTEILATQIAPFYFSNRSR